MRTMKHYSPTGPSTQKEKKKSQIRQIYETKCSTKNITIVRTVAHFRHRRCVPLGNIVIEYSVIIKHYNNVYRGAETQREGPQKEKRGTSK